MTQYIDGFLLSVPNDKLDAYKEMATTAGSVWIEHGALAYWETLEDDLKTDGRSFRLAADAKENESVVFAWVVYPSRAERDRIMAAVMADPKLQNCTDMPFDYTRMAYGGFKPMVVFNQK